MKRRSSLREKTYVAILSPVDRRRYAHRKRNGSIVGFVVQYETKVDDDWHPVVRYDCAHGMAHKDVLDIHGHGEKYLLGVSDLREALAIADADIRHNWQRYKTRFLGKRRRR